MCNLQSALPPARSTPAKELDTRDQVLGAALDPLMCSRHCWGASLWAGCCPPLETSMAPLLRCVRLIEFDNKRELAEIVVDH